MNVVINSKKDIYIDLALFINKLMLEDNLITYNLYKITKDAILKKIKSSIHKIPHLTIILINVIAFFEKERITYGLI